MKKAAAVFAVLCLFSALISAVFADVAWEPYADDFYMDNVGKGTMLYENRYYYAAADATKIYASPVDHTVKATVPRGVETFISHTYDDGDEKWGVVSLKQVGDTYEFSAILRDSTVIGWLRMSDMHLKYDNIEFTAEHEGEFVPYEGDAAEFLSGLAACAYTYPCSGELASETFVFSDPLEDWFEAGQIWKDADGNRWMFIPYYMAVRNCWICVDAPSNTELPAADVFVDYVPFDKSGTIGGADAIKVEKTPLTSDSNFLFGGTVTAAAALVIAALAIYYRINRKKSTER